MESVESAAAKGAAKAAFQLAIPMIPAVSLVFPP